MAKFMTLSQQGPGGAVPRRHQGRPSVSRYVQI